MNMKREYTPIETHIEALSKQAKGITVSYSLAFNEGGRPAVGIRKHRSDTMSDSIVIDGVAWLIAGDAFEDGKPLDTVSAISDADVASLTVELRAQAIICCNVVHVHLGSHKVASREILCDERGLLHLA